MAEVMRYAEMKDSGVDYIGFCPADWQVTRAKHVLTKLSRSMLPDDEVVICSNNGKAFYRGDKNSGLVSLTDNGYQGVEPGDLLIHGMDTWHGAVAISGIRGKCTSVVHVCESKENKTFISYYLKSLAYTDVYKAISNGVRQNTSDFRSWDKAGNILLLLPPKRVQDAIAVYLDDQCDRIDDIIASAKASIEEYKAWKASVIYEAVTKGLDASVEMKDSGVEWIGEIPKDWKMSLIGTLYDLRSDKVSDKDFPPLSVTKKGIVPQLATAAKTDDGDNRKLVRCGDFVINSRSDRRGSCGISDYDGSVSLINIVLEPRDEMNADYYNWLFHSEAFADEFYRWGRGIVDDLWTTRWSEMKQIIIPVPAPNEQQAISSYLDEQCVRIDQLISEKEALIADLESYKKSLIYEVVTGKRKVV